MAQRGWDLMILMMRKRRGWTRKVKGMVRVVPMRTVELSKRTLLSSIVVR